MTYCDHFVSSLIRWTLLWVLFRPPLLLSVQTVHPDWNAFLHTTEIDNYHSLEEEKPCQNTIPQPVLLGAEGWVKET